MESFDEKFRARFWGKVEKGGADACWLWTAAKCQGYGRIKLCRDGKPQSHDAHRVSYQIHHGPIPSGLVVMHSCDNRACVNPAHLRLGTVADNNKDRDTKGRSARVRGEKAGGAKLMEKEARDILQRGFIGEVQALLAAEYGVSQMSVSNLIRGVTWRHIHPPCYL